MWSKYETKNQEFSQVSFLLFIFILKHDKKETITVRQMQTETTWKIVFPSPINEKT